MQNHDSRRLKVAAIMMKPEDDVKLAAAAAAAAQYQGATDDVPPSSIFISPPTPRNKLVLPILTPAMQQDIMVQKGTVKSSKPLSIGARPEFADYPLQGIAFPHPNDVLCGRGGGSNSHPGNESFRDLVNDVKVLYVSCPKREKPLIARRIVEAVREQTPPGRFLWKDITGLWNDIGDGRAREKTSQALREGAPIIRCMVRGGPTESTDMDVATIVKEAKKEERANKDLCADMPQSNGDVNHTSEHITQFKMELPIIKCEYGSQGPVMMHMPSGVQFRETADSQPTVWPHAPPQPRRMFNIGMPYPQPYPHYAGHVMRGFVGPANHDNRPPPRDSVPLEIVRGLLLGQIDPVTLAIQMLSPQEAAFVARRHANSNVLVKPEPCVNDTPAVHTQHPPVEMVHTLHPPIISVNNAGSLLGSSPPRNISCESSSRSSSGECFMRQSPSEETSSVASSSRQSTIETPTKRALPKKKRKYIEESSEWDV